MVFKALNDLVPEYLSSMFTERSTPGYVLRDSTNKLNVPLPRTNYLKKSFPVTEVQLSETVYPAVLGK